MTAVRECSPYRRDLTPHVAVPSWSHAARRRTVAISRRTSPYRR